MRVKVKEQETNYSRSNYASNPVKENSSVIEGSFYQEKPMTIREMVTRKINKSLCFCLGITIAITFVSYYIAMNYEAKLNSLDNEIVRLNAENQDLQAELDKFKSFNNVDKTLQQNNILQRAGQVIETPQITVDTTASAKQSKVKKMFNYAIGF